MTDDWQGEIPYRDYVLNVLEERRMLSPRILYDEHREMWNPSPEELQTYADVVVGDVSEAVKRLSREKSSREVILSHWLYLRDLSQHHPVGLLENRGVMPLSSAPALLTALHHHFAQAVIRKRQRGGPLEFMLFVDAEDLGQATLPQTFSDEDLEEFMREL